MNFYKQIFENIFDIILIISDSGQIEYGNHAAIEAYGYSYDELIHKTIFEIRRNDTRDVVVRQLYHAISTGTEYEAKHYKMDDTSFQVIARPLLCEFEGENKIIEVIHNESNLRILENKAKMFDVSLDIAEEAVVAVDMNRCITLWNKAAERRLGYTANDLIGKGVDILIPQNRWEEWTVVQKLLDMGKVIEHIETVRHHKDGHLIDVSVSYSPLYNNEAKMIGFIGIYSDISEKKKVDNELKEYQERAAMALEGGKFCIWDIDLNQKNMLIYNNLELMLGYDKSEIGNDYEKWVELIHPEDIGSIYYCARHHIKNHMDMIMEYRIKSKSGTYQWVRSKGKVIAWNENNEPARMIGTAEEITDRKEIENELIKKNKALEEMSIKANEANEAKTLFLANMSHEIRTPLNGIISVVQLLQRTELNEEQKKLIRLLESSSVTLKGIVTDILDITKAEQQKIELNPVRFSLKDMMHVIFDELLIEANKKDIEAGYYYDHKINFDVIGDEQKIRQILNNIISNAIKFTDSGYISLKTNLIEMTDRHAMIGFEIKDSGKGISDDFQNKIFDIFTQEDISIDKKYGGTGLGLSISKRYARALGGDISFESLEGKGTSFYFLCPFEIVPIDNLAPDRISESDSTVVIPKKEISVKTVLSIDDNLVNQNVIEYIIEKMGYQYIGAYNSEEALKILQNRTVDLILMDIQLPGMNGYHLTQIIRQDIRINKIPIIAMTAYSQVEDREKCLSAGMDEFIIKPINVNVFTRTIDQMLMKRR